MLSSAAVQAETRKLQIVVKYCRLEPCGSFEVPCARKTSSLSFTHIFPVPKIPHPSTCVMRCLEVDEQSSVSAVCCEVLFVWKAAGRSAVGSLPQAR